MGRSVSTIRDRFYRDLILEYTNKGEQSFLYRYFWADGVSGLLEEYLPGFSMEGNPQPKDGSEIRARLVRALRENPDPEQARDQLLKKASGGSRRNFWAELWLNDAGYRAELISDTEYYLWLVECLAKRDIYYKDTSMWDQRNCLALLLREGLRDEKRTLEPGCQECKSSNEKNESRFTTAQLKRDLAELAEKLRREHETGKTEIADRLHGLKCRVRTQKGTRKVDYLLWLTGRLARMALHIRIKTWLQDSGYPLIKPEDQEASEDGTRTEPFTTGPRRKRDFSMGLFEAYCSGPWGYEFYKKDPAGATAPEGWCLNRVGFCMLDASHMDALHHALEGSQETSLNIPLAVDLYSGCVFFLAGKGLYEAVYLQEIEKRRNACKDAKEAYEQAKKTKEEYGHRMQQDPDHLKRLGEDLLARKKIYDSAVEKYNCALKAKKEFDDTQSRFCFDYLRLDEEHLDQFQGDVRGALRLGPHFHENAPRFLENAKESREVLLNKFRWYCVEGDDSLRARLREFNADRPAGLRDSDMFRWAFDDQ